jgi:hypothetical protein
MGENTQAARRNWDDDGVAAWDRVWPAINKKEADEVARADQRVGLRGRAQWKRQRMV